MMIDTPHKSLVPALRGLWLEAFDDEEEYPNAFVQTAFSADRCRCVTVNGELAAALYWFDCLHKERRIAYLYAIATAKAYRRQGICHKLMEDTHRHLTSRGYEGAILVPGSKELFEFYKKMGYRTCCYIQEFSCDASAEKAELRQLELTEYAELRRQLLPKGGVIQENENLEFLQTQAAFYKGEGFLLAAEIEADTLCGLELLGDKNAAPGILRALGCEKGYFRAPGGNIPFAMYYPFGNSNLAPPSYFGLAFD